MSWKLKFKFKFKESGEISENTDTVRRTVFGVI